MGHISGLNCGTTADYVFDNIGHIWNTKREIYMVENRMALWPVTSCVILVTSFILAVGHHLIWFLFLFCDEECRGRHILQTRREKFYLATWANARPEKVTGYCKIIALHGYDIHTNRDEKSRKTKWIKCTTGWRSWTYFVKDSAFYPLQLHAEDVLCVLSSIMVNFQKIV